MGDELMYIPMKIHKITLSIRLQLVVEMFGNKPTNQNAMIIPKVTEPKNK